MNDHWDTVILSLLSPLLFRVFVLTDIYYYHSDSTDETGGS